MYTYKHTYTDTHLPGQKHRCFCFFFNIIQKSEVEYFVALKKKITCCSKKLFKPI